MNDFISDDELRTFEGWLKYQAVPATATQEELREWRSIFDENERLRASIPRFGRMKLRPIAGEQRYGVAIQGGAEQPPRGNVIELRAPAI